MSVHVLHLCPLVSMLSSFGSFSFYFVIFLGFVLLTQASINSSPFVKCTLPSPILHEHICIYVNMLCLISVSLYFLCILALVPVPCCPYVPLTLFWHLLLQVPSVFTEMMMKLKTLTLLLVHEVVTLHFPASLLLFLLLRSLAETCELQLLDYCVIFAEACSVSHHCL